jgi:hypothetical protein
MITLTRQWLGLSGCNVYADDVDALTYYVIPESPRIALDDSGKPIFSLVWYRRPVDQLTEEERKTRLGGGLLTFSVELARTADQEQQIRRTIAADPAVHQLLEQGNPLGGPDYRNWWLNEIHQDQARLADALKIDALPVVDGSVTVAVLGEDPDHLADFLATVIGAGGVSMTGNERAAFMAKLTQDGAVLLWDMLEKNLPAIRIGYDLRFDYRMTGVRMVVWCDAEKSYRAVQEQWDHINDNASWSVTYNDDSTEYRFSHDKSTDAGSRLQITAVDSESARVEVIPEAGPDSVKPEVIAELMQQGNEMIKDFLAATFLEFKAGQDFKPDEEPTLDTALATQDGKPYGHHGIDYYKLKDWSESMRATLDYQTKALAVVEGHVRPNDNLANVLGGQQVTGFRTQIELDAAWYRFIDVQVVCTADFDQDPVDLVKAHLSYHASGAQGRVDEETDPDLVFQKDTPPQRFTTYLASPQQDQYDYSYTVFYKGSDQHLTVSGKSKETVLVLDTDRMGVLRVDVQAGLMDWNQFQSAIVKLSYGAGPDRKEAEFVIDSAHQSQRWVEVIAKEVTEPYTYQLTFVDKQDQRMEFPAATSREKTLVIDQPISALLEVTLVPAGSFGTGGLLSQVVVAVRYRDDAHDYAVDNVFTMTNEGDSKTWTVPLVDKTLRSYEYRVTVFYSDGVTREDDWQTTDRTVLPVGDPFGYRVQILPYLLKNPPGLYQFGTIHLGFDDTDARIHAEKDFQITDFTQPLTWRFRLGDPNRHTYSYQLTLFKSDGQQVALPEAQDSKEVLVLVPPAPQ